jgi:hypothetical protein
MPPRSSSRTAPAPVKPVEPVEPNWLSLPVPSWVTPVLILLAAVLLISLFTTESGDPDTWWHLATGQYVVQQHKLPLPDPFSWTTHLGTEAYPGEETTRRFNLTHEWLSQVAMYLAFASGGFTGLILLRAVFLTILAGLIGLIAYRRSSSFYLSMALALCSLNVMRQFVADRPQYFTYVFLALTILILESRKRLWLLPPLFVIWANCHAGFIMGWVVMGAYCGESLLCRWRGKPQADERGLWAFCLASIAVSGLNPNYFNVVRVIGYYRQSPMQAGIWEWQRPKYWELSPFTIMMYGSAALLLLQWRKSRPVDWMLLAVFSVSALMATRNIFLIGLWAPVMLATYAPRFKNWKDDFWASAAMAVILALTFYFFSFFFSIWVVVGLAAVTAAAIVGRWPVATAGLTGLLLLAGLQFQISGHYGFQFRGGMWKYPEAAADFILKHNLKGRMFNTYGQGGYLIWKLWPHQQVFLDGRALNEKVNADSNRIAMNADDNGGKSGEQLLKDYGIDLIVMDGFDPVGGTAYYLPAALADPSQKEWKLVYQDIHDVIYMRNPPPDVQVLKSLDALGALEQQCEFWVKNGQPLCSRGMVDIFGRIGDRTRYDKWRKVYQDNRSAEAQFTVVKK